MGTDIEIYVEKLVNGKWLAADLWQPAGDGDSSLKVPWDLQFYRRREYGLFAILADVRNDGYVPIAEPRGLPLDVCPEIAAASEHLPDDLYSFSYFTLAELMEYDWTQVVTLEGFVTALDHWEWDAVGRQLRPRAFSYRSKGGVQNWGVEVSDAQMRRQVKMATEPYEDYYGQQKAVRALGDEMYAHVVWDEPYYKGASRFLSETMPRLWRVGPPDEVRIVFWFWS